MSDYISLKEASRLTGKAEITIRRLIKHLHSQDKTMYKQMIKRGKGKNSPIFISVSRLKQYFNIAGESKQRVSNEQGASSQESKPLMDTLTETIEVLRGQLKIKDGQIAELMKAQERGDTLLQNSQKQLLLLEHKAETEKKSSFIKRLFGG